MAVVRWDPWSELAALQRDVQELFSRQPSQPRTASLIPAMDAFRTSDGLVVRLELPGFSPDEIEVTVNDGVLTVSGERRVDADVPDDAWLRRERVVGRFERGLTLPEGTPAEGINASFENGLLQLHIPHAPQRAPHRISVNSGQAGDTGTTVDVSAAASSSSNQNRVGAGV